MSKEPGEMDRFCKPQTGITLSEHKMVEKCHFK